MSTTHVPAALRERVAHQAGHRCGYCRTTKEIIGSPLEIDHLMPEARSGLTVEANLWLACSACNNAKDDRTTALDPHTGEGVPLFNPRTQRWPQHFTWAAEADHVLGITPSGRATVVALKLNRPLLVRARRLWIRIGLHPPEDSADDHQIVGVDVIAKQDQT